MTLGSSKVGKVAKIATKANKLVDMVKSSKVVSRANKFVDVAKASQTASKVNKVVDSSKTFVKSNVNKLLDTPLRFSPQLVGASGRTINVGGTTFREMGQNAKKGFDNLVQSFVKNGDEIAQGSGKPNLTKFIIMLLIGVKPILQRWKE
ncbi:hypothetical protein MKL26_07010 [Streptococcus suis]|nr:hypothetical protein [Streptococcus suis]